MTKTRTKFRVKLAKKYRKNIIKNSFNPVEQQNLERLHIIFKFQNGYGASLLCCSGSYGSELGLYEMAVLIFKGDEWDFCYDTEITNDILGHLSEDNVIDYLEQIKSL